ncbi:glycosyltransferase family 1 protein [Podospora didyma]|uniref:Glycosyltransferase family 1 protein n=1 Tax=Podospora didyma TaxID=330526 RepID=A0AAE0U0V8_9PEZI|nr:glycosyltransferase family 1 protein [Podospora didyma]
MSHLSLCKPVIVVLAFPSPGHLTGLIQISAHLVQKGFKVILIGYEDYKAAIEKSGAEYVAHTWRWVLPPPDGLQLNHHERLVKNLKFVFADATPATFTILKQTLERVREQFPRRQVIILFESLAQGILPFVYGAPLPKGFDSFPKVINFNTTMYLASHPSVPPFGPGLPYDPTEENLNLWKAITDARMPSEIAMNGHYNDIMRPLGTTRDMTGWMWDTLMEVGDVTVLPTTFSTDYPRPIDKKKVRFIGGLPLKPMSPDFVYPKWWPEITSNAALPASSPDKKKVVLVAQGTAQHDYTELILPTISALSSRDDIIVVATLGKRGATLDDELSATLPANAKAIDYLPYDALLPYTDVFVSNGGYGGFMHGIMNGTPMVLAGTLADKAEVASRAEYIGVAVNLRTGWPTPEALRDAIDKVLTNDSFKKKAVQLKEENEAMDALGQVEGIIDELTEK